MKNHSKITTTPLKRLGMEVPPGQVKATPLCTVLDAAAGPPLHGCPDAQA